jgi:hypothetical protein
VALAVAGVAVAAALVVAVAPLAGFRTPWAGPGASPTAAPGTTFEPYLAGPGILAGPSDDPGFLVLIGVLLLSTAALIVRGRRKVLPIAAVIGLVGYALVAAFAPVTLNDSGFGTDLATTMAEEAPASGETIVWEEAAPGEPSVVGLWLGFDAALPVTFDGVIEPASEEDRLPFYPTWHALWLDEQLGDGGSITKPAKPFTPVELRSPYVPIWLVGRAGMCAVGPAFDPADPDPATAYAILDRITVQVRVLGWPRTIEYPLPFRLSEPMPDPCPAAVSP